MNSDAPEFVANAAESMILAGGACAAEVFRQVHPQIENLSAEDAQRWLTGFVMGQMSYVAAVLGKEMAVLIANASIELETE